MKVWFITNETISSTGLSLVGIFSTKEKALDNLRNDELGDELFFSIEWEYSEYNPDFAEGFDSRGCRYILCSTEVDNP